MTTPEFIKLRMFEKLQKRGKQYGMAQRKSVWSTPAPSGFIKIERGGAVETNRRKF
jgi:hypothetical protein